MTTNYYCYFVLLLICLLAMSYGTYMVLSHGIDWLRRRRQHTLTYRSYYYGRR